MLKGEQYLGDPKNLQQDHSATNSETKTASDPPALDDSSGIYGLPVTVESNDGNKEEDYSGTTEKPISTPAHRSTPTQGTIPEIKPKSSTQNRDTNDGTVGASSKKSSRHDSSLGLLTKRFMSIVRVSFPCFSMKMNNWCC